MVLDDKTKSEVGEVLSVVDSEVSISIFLNGNEYSSKTRELLEELAQINNKLKFTFLDEEEAKKQKIEMLPVIKFSDNAFYHGIPSGYEFQTVLEMIVQKAVNVLNLNHKIQESVQKIVKKTSVKVFVTPSCPYCPRMAKIALQSALLNKNIQADVFEANEFQEISEKYEVMGVPKTVINETKNFEGAMPEAAFVSELLQASGIIEEKKKYYYSKKDNLIYEEKKPDTEEITDPLEKQEALKNGEKILNQSKFVLEKLFEQYPELEHVSKHILGDEHKEGHED
jgi:glutaredoxin-like protein